MGKLEKATYRLLHSIEDACKDYYGGDLVSLVVFGSVARNTQTFTSDIDILLIVKELPNGRMNRMRDFLEIEDKLDGDVQKARNNGWYVDLSPIIRTPEEVSMGGYLYLDMIDDAVLLYDKDNFFSSFLDDLKGRLENYGARKRTWKGGYYWEIKPDIKPGEVIRL